MQMIDVLKRLQEIAETTPELVKDAVENVQRTNPANVKEGGMSDIHIGAQEAVGEYQDDNGNLKMPKRDVVQDLVKRSKEASFPLSYELETAAKMAADEYEDDGTRKAEADLDGPFEAKAELNTDTMENKQKETVKEAIQISADTPQEASMMMQMLKLAGVQPVDAKMIGADEPQAEPEIDTDDAAGSMDMARMRDIVKLPDEEKAEETFANEPDEKTQDVDSLVNVHSGGLNKQKVQYRKEYPGDNPMAVAKEDKITEEELANSLRTQYENFKQAYQEGGVGNLKIEIEDDAAQMSKEEFIKTHGEKYAHIWDRVQGQMKGDPKYDESRVNEAAKPDYIDLDKDGNKTEPMKKAAQDKEAKNKK
jgi:hypothetical protein